MFIGAVKNFADCYKLSTTVKGGTMKDDGFQIAPVSISSDQKESQVTL